MPSFDPRQLVKILHDLYNPPFDTLLEAVMGESRQWADLKDWETNSTKWGVNERGQHVGSKDYNIDANDVEKTAVGGASISKRQYIFLPMTFAINAMQGEEILKRILGDLRLKGSVKVSTWPGYGVEGEGAYPAMVISKLPAETRSMVQDQIGQGGIIYAVDGVPLSEYMVKTMELPGAEGEDEWTRLKKWLGGGAGESGEGGGREDYVPEWLMRLSGEIEGAIKAKRVRADISRMKGFEGELVLSTPSGDAVMVISKRYAKAAYILRKKMNLDGAPTDYDVAISTKMNEFLKDYHRKPRGEKMRTDFSIDDIMALKRKSRGALDRAGEQPSQKRLPRFLLRDWLGETDNGYILRRDVRAEDIRRLIGGGLRFEDGRTLAASSAESESAFSYNLNKVLSEDVVMESENTIQGYLDVMYSPWSMDEHRLFEYLKTLSPEEIDDWVSALEIVVEQGVDGRWVHGLTERTLKELPLSDMGRARTQGILTDLQAPPEDDDEEEGEAEEIESGEPPAPPPPPKPDFDDDYNPESGAGFR